PPLFASFPARRSSDLFLAAVFGGASGLLGNIFSVLYNLPTGPAIVLTGSSIALLALLFAPKRGLLFRLFRIWAFRLRCTEENLRSEEHRLNSSHVKIS